MRARWLAIAGGCLWGLSGAQQPPPAAPPATPPAAAPATAAPRATVYNVELVIFRATAALGAAEDWSLETPSDLAAHVEGDAEAPAAPPVGAGQSGGLVHTLAPADFQLNDIEGRLRANGAYAPIAHVAWSQTASPWGSHAAIPAQQLGLDGTGVSGTVSLERGQFLHLALALSYVAQNPPAGLGGGPGTTFTLNDSHRVRFYERNYFDHPAFGVIALVTPAQSRPAGR
jgi:hypothetical protein